MNINISSGADKVTKVELQSELQSFEEKFERKLDAKFDTNSTIMNANFTVLIEMFKTQKAENDTFKAEIREDLNIKLANIDVRLSSIKLAAEKTLSKTFVYSITILSGIMGVASVIISIIALKH